MRSCKKNLDEKLKENLKYEHLLKTDNFVIYTQCILKLMLNMVNRSPRADYI